MSMALRKLPAADMKHTRFVESGLAGATGDWYASGCTFPLQSMHARRRGLPMIIARLSWKPRDLALRTASTPALPAPTCNGVVCGASHRERGSPAIVVGRYLNAVAHDRKRCAARAWLVQQTRAPVYRLVPLRCHAFASALSSLITSWRHFGKRRAASLSHSHCPGIWAPLRPN